MLAIIKVATENSGAEDKERTEKEDSEEERRAENEDLGTFSIKILLCSVRKSLAQQRDI